MHRPHPKAFLIPVAALLAALLAGCPSSPPAPTVDANVPPAPDRPAISGRVGIALASMSHNFFIGMRQGLEDQFTEDGVEYEVLVADDSASQQQQQVDQLILGGVSAIVMNPVDALQAINAVRAANEAGIPIFCIDRRVTAEGAEVTCTVETDNVAMGEMAARHGLKLLCERYSLQPENPDDVKKLKSQIVHLWGLESTSAAQDRAKGFDRVFNEEATPGVEIIKAVGNFNSTRSQEVIAPILTANPNLELILCHNDDNAIGALNAVIDIKQRRAPADDPQRVFIIGIDGNQPAIEQIRKGAIEATASQEPIEMGRLTAIQVRRVLEGGRPQASVILIRHHLVTQKEAVEGQGELWSDQLKGGI